MKNAGKVLIQLSFLIVAFIFILIISLGITFDLKELATVKFWVVVACKLAVVMIIFNFIILLDQRNQMTDKNSLLFKTMATNQLKIAEIYKQKCFEQLEAAVKTENENNLINKYNCILHNVTTRISYDDLLKDKEIKSLEEIQTLCDKFLLSKKQKKQLIEKAQKIVSGKVKIEEVTAEELLKDKEANKIPKNALKYDTKNQKGKQNINKMFNFLVSSIITTAIGFSLVTPNFWTELIKNGLLFVGTIVSGMTTSYWESRQKVAIFDNRNKFFNKNLDIKTEYIPEKSDR